MAGKEQHTLPKFLMKGFASKIIPKKKKKDVVFVWWYHKNHKAKEIPTDDFGRSYNFYGESLPGSIDDKITQREITTYSKLIHKLRKLDKDLQVHDALIPEFIAHLSVRTKHVRDVFTDRSTDLVKGIFSLFTNSESLSEWLNEIKEKESFQKEMNNLFTSDFAELFRMFIPSEYKPDDVSNITNQIKAGEEKTLSIMPTSIKEGHLKGLKKSIAPEARIKFYEQMNWFILTSISPLILGDFGCLVETDNKRRFKVIPYELEEIENILLPVSTNKMLVGTKSSEIPKVNFNEINEVIAKCSREFFISSLFFADFEKLQSVIRTYSDFDNDKEIKEIMDDIRNLE